MTNLKSSVPCTLIIYRASGYTHSYDFADMRFAIFMIEDMLSTEFIPGDIDRITRFEYRVRGEV